MKTAAIIAEYNPFHNGHKYHIEATRAAGATHIIAVMSGSAVQRGEFSAFSKHTRAKAALLNGADLVIELPCIYSLASAQRFAEGAVKTIEALGIADMLSFGSESGDISQLSLTADMLAKLDGSEILNGLLKQGYSYPAAKQKAVEQLSNGAASIITSPNDTLAVEYLCALKKLNSDIRPLAITRSGAGHDSGEVSNDTASASYIRGQIKAGKNPDTFIPGSAARLYTSEVEGGNYQIDTVKFQTALLYALKSCSRTDFEALPDVSEGLHNRLYDAARKATSTEEFYTLAKTKRYTHARLRRISMYALIGTKKSDLHIQPAYARVLGANAQGKQLLALARKTSQIPCITAFSKAAVFSERLAFLDSRATDLHTLLSRSPLPCGQDYYNNAVLLD